jgi:hypothetical protein
MFELIVDPEFIDLIPPLDPDEYTTLENNIVNDGFSPAYPIITWRGIIIDGHNRYSVCVKHNIEFITVEYDFESREDVIDWMVDNQLSRRNIDSNTRAFLIGKKYNKEKKGHGGNRSSRGNNCLLKTDERLAQEFSTSPKTVKNNEVYFKSVEKICSTGEIGKNDVLSDISMKDANKIAKLGECDLIQAIANIKNNVVITSNEERVVNLNIQLDIETRQRMKEMQGQIDTATFIKHLINEKWAVWG